VREIVDFTDFSSLWNVLDPIKNLTESLKIPMKNLTERHLLILLMFQLHSGSARFFQEYLVEEFRDIEKVVSA